MTQAKIHLHKRLPVPRGTVRCSTQIIKRFPQRFTPGPLESVSIHLPLVNESGIFSENGVPASLAITTGLPTEVRSEPGKLRTRQDADLPKVFAWFRDRLWVCEAFPSNLKWRSAKPGLLGQVMEDALRERLQDWRPNSWRSSPDDYELVKAAFQHACSTVGPATHAIDVQLLIA